MDPGEETPSGHIDDVELTEFIKGKALISPMIYLVL